MIEFQNLKAFKALMHHLLLQILYGWIDFNLIYSTQYWWFSHGSFGHACDGGTFKDSGGDLACIMFCSIFWVCDFIARWNRGGNNCFGACFQRKTVRYVSLIWFEIGSDF